MPPPSNPRPARKPIATRNSGGTKLLSNEYLTKNATPRNSARPPTHAKSFTPKNFSQLISAAGTSSGSGVDRGGGEKSAGGCSNCGDMIGAGRGKGGVFSGNCCGGGGGCGTGGEAGEGGRVCQWRRSRCRGDVRWHQSTFHFGNGCARLRLRARSATLFELRQFPR